MRKIGQRRATDAFVSFASNTKAYRTLQREGVPFQTLAYKGRKVRVYLKDDVERVGVDVGSNGLEGFVSNTGIVEMLGIPPGNIEKTFKRNGVESQTLTLGERVMRVYLRDDVERFAEERKAKKKR